MPDDIDYNSLEKFLTQFTGASPFDVSTALETLRSAGISDILPEFRSEIQREMWELYIDLNKDFDICYCANHIVIQHAIDSLSDLIQDTPRFHEFSNYSDSSVNFYNDTLDKVHDAIVEKLKNDPEYTIENDPVLNDAAKYLIVNDSNFDFNDCVKRAKQESSSTMSL